MRAIILRKARFYLTFVFPYFATQSFTYNIAQAMKKITKLSLASLAGVLLLFSVAFKPDYFEISKQLDIFTNVFKEVSLYYVDETQPGELMTEAMESMLESLDPYTTYIPEERVEDFKIQTTGNYGGIGASIRKRGDEIVLTTPYEGFAADKAGFKAGDRILEIDGKPVTGKSTDDVSTALKGAAGTEVTLKVERAGKEIIKTFEREDVHVKSVPYYGMLDNNIGYIVLTSFTDKASKEVKAALKELKKENEELQGLVLDLRGNPGGLLNEAVNITNIFIEKGKEVVDTKGKMEEWEKTYKTLNSPDDLEIPLAVLINRGSASASEIVSGTLQDYDRAVIIGQRSFGKGLVQQTRQLSYGAQLKVTIAKYYTPSGRCIQAINYAERDEDGSVIKIPDSLRTKFTTANGRPVFDGGGIDPDIEMEPEDLSPIIISLYKEMLLFDWATEYARAHQTIAPAKEFELTDAEYTSFVKWVEDKEFHYNTETEKALDELELAAKDESYFEDLETEIASLKKRYESRHSNDLMANKAQIKRLLEEEIASRYYYDSGRIANALHSDKEIDKAIEVLKNKAAYDGILTASVAKKE